MHSEYDGVKYYGRNDLSVGWELEKAEPIIEVFSAEKKVETINEIIELFNIRELLGIGVKLPKWSDATYIRFNEKAKSITGVVAKYFAQISDDNFIAVIQNVTIGYMVDFWTLFDKFKVYNRVSPEIFLKYLKMPDTALYEILAHKKIVEKYDEQLAQVLRTSDQTCRILVSQFLEKNDKKYYLPESLTPNEYESIFQKYIDSESVNPNLLRLIFDAQSTKACPVSDKLRLNAKRKFKNYWANPGPNVTYLKYGLKMAFTDQVETKKGTCEGSVYFITYDIKWLEENFDYPTIMNNFTYVFDMFDMRWRSTLVSVNSQIGALENIFVPKGVRFYQRGRLFDVAMRISSMQMLMYYDFLKVHDVDLEDVFVWFFSDYLKEEFCVDGFTLKASSATNYAERCRTLASEMDGVLKQYRMYVRDGYIDRELFEMSSDHLVIDGMQSLIKEKYAYACGDAIQNEIFMLFSNQPGLSFTSKTKSKHSTLFELLKNEIVVIDDFSAWQVQSINWLIERNALNKTDNGRVELNHSRVGILKDLYDHEVICVKYLGKWTPVLFEMRDAGDLRIESTLFSEPEKKFLNYELNKAEFSDGLDLRNKYAHSTYPQNEDVQKMDYIELLKVMVLIITKINEEFCLIED